MTAATQDAPADPSTPAPSGGAGLRTDIQALRALAVMLVVVYHLWPNRVSGGFVGVDVFFVVSGFLITGHLLREVAVDGRVRLGRFWARRARRLLPASLLVVFVSLVATRVWVPESLWSQFFRELLASVLYVENWVLAADSIDYLAAENAASPVQHFWSLAIEEQFYVVWPLLIALVVTLATRRGVRSPYRPVASTMVVVCVVGLVVSVWWTAASPSVAYFATPTRIWEFGAGGLLAVVMAPGQQMRRPGAGVRAFLTLVGVAAIVATGFVYDGATPFPGWTALIPVIGTVIVIGAGPDGVPGRASVIVDHRVTQWVGDLSYSLYLWHWPLIVLTPFITGSPLDRTHKLVILVLSFVLADATKRFVEDPIRWNSWLSSSSVRTYGAALALMAIVGGASFASLRAANAEAEAAIAGAEALLEDGSVCYGAAAVLEPEGTCAPPPDDALIPAVAALAQNTGGAYSCYQSDQPEPYERCTYGVEGPDAVRVAVVGDSHAAQLLPGLWEELDGVGWSLDSFVGRGCIWMAPDPESTSCDRRNTDIQTWFETAEPYDAIIVTLARDRDVFAGTADPRSQRLADAWAPVIARGTTIVAVADNPLLPEATFDCVLSITSVADAERCTMPRDVALANTDALVDAVELAGAGAVLLETVDAYCTDDDCPVVIGNVIVYRDRHHITASYSRTLGPYLVREIERILDR